MIVSKAILDNILGENIVSMATKIRSLLRKVNTDNFKV